MTQLNTEDLAGELKPKEPGASIDEPRKGDYRVGRNRPPVETRFKPGQSGNPKGRPKGRRNVKTELKEILSKKVTIRDAENTRKVSLPAANILAHAFKGAKGDVRSSSLFLNCVLRLGLLDEDANQANERHHVSPAAGDKSRSADELFDQVDLNFLSRDEQIELSRIADVIDLGGDITALSTADFERLKQIINKGRGTNVIAH